MSSSVKEKRIRWPTSSATAGATVVPAPASTARATAAALRHAVMQELRELGLHAPGTREVRELTAGLVRGCGPRAHRPQQRVARRVLALDELDHLDPVADESQDLSPERVGQ